MNPHRAPWTRIVLPLLLVLALLSTSGLPLQAATPAERAAGDTPTAEKDLLLKVIAAPGLLGDIKPWHDYGPFALYRLSAQTLAGLPGTIRSQLTIDPELDTILFDRHPLDTRSGQLDLAEELTIKATSGAALHLVQFVGPIRQEWIDALVAAGAAPVHYIANNAYLAWADPAARQQLDALAQQGDFLQYSSPHQPGFKLGPSIEQRILARSNPDEVVPVDIQIYDHPGKQASQDLIASLTVATEAGWWPILAFENASISVRARDLLTLARLPDVVWVGERFPRQLDDEVQGQIMASNFDGSQSGPSAPGYLAWLDSFGFSQNPADYPIVSVSDDGVGNGSVTNGAGDDTLTLLRDGVTTRLAFIANCTPDTAGDSEGGHGHINTSIVGGYDQRSGSPYRDTDGYLRGLGLNPYGRLAGTKIFRNNGSYSVTNCGGTDAGVIKRQQDNGALISTNSWGCASCAGTYDTSSQAYDVGVRDADTGEAGNQQMAIVFSAGNSGSGAGTIGTPGNAKNVLTVGASENDRPTWTDGCGVGPTGADNAMDIISFSSRGPAPGGRVKPETIAPGTHIQGTASPDSGYDGSGVCDQYQPTGQTIFAASSGTSHSTPAVAGTTSLYYYWLQNTHGVTTPAPALLKAYVLAHPTYLTGVSANDTLPSNNQGYGMPDMDVAFDNTPRVLVNQTTTFDNSGETWTWSGSVADPSKPLRIVLNYTDAAGATGTSPQVNNLNLSAVVNGSTYLGNRFSGRWSVTGGSADSANNYEAIFLPAGTSGAVNITVTAFNIAGNGVPNVGDSTDQDFALVCYNCTQQPDFALSVTPASQAICAGADTTYTVDLSAIAGFNSPVTLSASGIPAGTTATFSPNPVTPPGASTLTIGNTGGAAAGTYNLTVTGVSGARNHSANVTLTVSTPLAAAPALTAPINGSTGASTTPTFTWSAVAGAVSYNIQVAADPEFNTIVASATGLTTTSYTPGSALAAGAAHYWRVRAVNGCGAGAYSAAAAFVTSAGGTSAFCVSPNVAIPDGNTTGVNDSQTIATSGLLTDLNVSVQATHTWVGDLIFTLRNSGTGTSVTIIDRPGVPDSTYGCSGNNIAATLDDQAASSVENQCASSTPAINGTFQPNNPLSAFSGQQLANTWTLNASDRASNDTGTLTQWCLIATYGSTLAADYSDLASSYGVAWHTGGGTLRLGPTWTADTAFGPGADTDDGVTFIGDFTAGLNAAVRVNVQGAAANGRWLKLWFDWNSNGVFDTAELVYNAATASGDNDLAIPVPASLAGPVKYRARLFDSASGALALDAIDAVSYDGAAGGEVEDGESPQPLAVDLAAFTAEAAADGVTLAWETVSETDNAGFNIDRADTELGPWTRLNAALIPAAAPGSGEGHAYTWTDATAQPNTAYVYRLEAIALDGTAEVLEMTGVTYRPAHRRWLPIGR